MKAKWLDFIIITAIILFTAPYYAYARGGIEDLIGSLFIGFIVFLVIFLILREFFCWYWKINERIVLLNEIRDLLSKNVYWIEQAVQKKKPAVNRANLNVTKCEFCKKSFPKSEAQVSRGRIACPECIKKGV